MTQIFSMFSILLSLMFLLETTPLYLSLVIILQTIILAVILALFTMSSWFSFMLLMIYLSGMMIVFIYVSSMASNELFNPTRNLMPFSLAAMLILLFLLFPFYYLKPSDSLSHLSLDLLQTTVFKTSSIYSKSLFIMTILLIIYLLLAMIMVVKVSSFSEGPMRSSK
uniref:NADH-ubiquinone oxidoreductase chain 6 n=1 Tax=Pseudoniphargus sp. 1-Portugal TaxID=2212668 RepID=A0A345K5S1_9CRUS|nr:NADH dehydrogenase subunit 6 [Pseudoniphargus sp. 1-Portugal]